MCICLKGMPLTLPSTAGSDYHDPVVTTVTFGDDVTSRSYPVPILNDNVIEDTETFTVTLNTSESYVNIVDDAATVTISDDDSELYLYTRRNNSAGAQLAFIIVHINICGST